MDEKSGGLVDFFKSGKGKEMEQAREQKEKELIQQHECELQSMQLSMKKVEHELGQMEAQMKRYKNMAGEIAE